ncbi:MAG TPA: hypothetical protein VMV92_31825 [Streptosporangiaceae bacterium]|nr:hypothetical protein [Streptosporangiaceae bacterium]
MWLRPGQRGLPRASHLIGSGTAGGSAWSVTGYVGPWGRCLVARGGGTIASGCVATFGPPGTSVMGWTTGPPRVVYGSAGASVVHVVVTLSDRTSIRVRAGRAGDQKFFAFALGKGQRAVRWRAYDSARHVVASGHISGG